MTQVLLAQVCSALLALSLSVGQLLTRQRGRPIRHLSPSERLDIKKSAREVLRTTIMVQTAIRSPIFFLSVMTSGSLVAIYEAAVRIGGLSLLVTSAVSAAATPLFSRASARANREEEQALYALTSSLQALPALAVFLVIAISGESLLITMFGNSYASSYWPAVIASVSLFCLSIMEVSIPFLQAKNLYSVVTRASMWWLACLFLLLPVGISLLGAIGAATAVSFSALLRGLILTRYVAKNFALTPAPFTFSHFWRWREIIASQGQKPKRL